jgi:glucose/arabinose dehydrogenase
MLPPLVADRRIGNIREQAEFQLGKTGSGKNNDLMEEAMWIASRLPVIASAALVALCVAAAPAWAQGKSNSVENRSQGKAATANSIGPDQAIGKRFRVSADELPPPKASPAVSNGPLSLPFDGQTLKLAEGFSATLFARLDHPRRLLVLPNGDVIVAEQRLGYLTLLRDADGDGKAEWIERYAQDFNQPYGLAWREAQVLVADQDGIWKIPHKLGDVRTGHGESKAAAEVPPEKRKPSPHVNAQELLTKKGVFGLVKGHANRPLLVDPKTGALFVGVGSSGNIGIEPEVKATIQRFEADGSGQTTYISGTRNPCGLAIHPDSGELWAVVQERDGLGDKLVPDYLVRAEQGGFYGWPYAYIGQNPQPGFADKAPDKVKASKRPDLLFQAHSSAMDLVFYDGTQFPTEYRGHAFVVLKGSWNASQPTGYKVVRVPFKNGRPEGSYENFVTGFWVSGTQRAEVWGRPAAIAVAKDGALLIADDVAGTIWRVFYSGPPRKSAG